MYKISDYIDNQKLLDRLSEYSLELEISELSSNTIEINIIDNSTDDAEEVGYFEISLNDNGKIDLEEFVYELSTMCREYSSDSMIREYANGYDEWKREQIVDMFRNIEQNLNDFAAGLNISALYEINSLSDVKTIKDLEFLKDFNDLSQLSGKTINDMYLELAQHNRYATYIEFFEKTKDLWGGDLLNEKEVQIAILNGKAKNKLCYKLDHTANHCASSLNDKEKEKLVKIVSELDVRPTGGSSYDEDFLIKYGQIGSRYGNNSPELISHICYQFSKDLGEELQDYEFKDVDFKRQNESSKTKQR